MKSQLIIITLILFGISIAIIYSSILFQQDAHGLILEYQNVSTTWKNIRLHFCTECSRPEKVHLGCGIYSRSNCYQDAAETQASLLDYTQLLVLNTYEGFGKYRDTYQLTSTDKGEAVVKGKEAQLMQYPKMWLGLCLISICLVSVMCILLLVGLVLDSYFAKFQKHQLTINLLWMILFAIFSISFLVLFIVALVWKADYVCPGLAYESKYGGSDSSSCEGVYTYGRGWTGLLGGGMIVLFLSTGYFSWCWVKEVKLRK